MRWSGHVARTGGQERDMMGRVKGKRPLARLKHKWEDNVTGDLQDV
jgi:hypothetical protein